jgi:hypothetical protein
MKRPNHAMQLTASARHADCLRSRAASCPRLVPLLRPVYHARSPAKANYLPFNNFGFPEKIVLTPSGVGWHTQFLQIELDWPKANFSW